MGCCSTDAIMDALWPQLTLASARRLIAAPSSMADRKGANKIAPLRGIDKAEAKRFRRMLTDCLNRVEAKASESLNVV